MPAFAAVFTLDEAFNELCQLAVGTSRSSVTGFHADSGMMELACSSWNPCPILYSFARQVAFLSRSSDLA